MKHLMCGIMLLICAAAVPLAAQDRSLTAESSIDSLYIDFSIPDLSAFTMLGVNSNQISRPNTVKELSAALLNSAGSLGSIATGVAVEWAPAQTFGRMADSTIRAYRAGYLLRSLQITYATVKADTATRMAFGLKLTPFDAANPLLNKHLEDSIQQEFAAFAQQFSPARRASAFSRRIDSVITALGWSSAIDTVSALFFPSPLPASVTPSALITAINAAAATKGLTATATQNAALLGLVADYNTLLQQIAASYAYLTPRLARIKANYRDANWNASSAGIAVGGTALSPNSTWSSLALENVVGFVGGTAGIGTWGQLVAQARIAAATKAQPTFRQDSSTNIRDSAATVANTPFERSSWSLGGRILLGGSDVHGTIEALYTRASFAATLVDSATSTSRAFESNASSLRLTFGFEFKLTDGTWLELAIGSDSRNSPDGKQSLLALGNLKYAFVKQPEFAIP